ncbi:Sporulation-specific protein spo7 [Mycena sanguinolenta]|uniref:Transmembrane protein 188 n=1 Tax=Mycena sanguinolenta TaxID=230812 RepID=A0A8H6YW64_9AGAR|nr:Sporulation-specific protein spo7 [Mycena sanguinolenta]
MRLRSTPSPKGSVYPQNDVATYRDLLLFEERLKTTAVSLQRRKSRYQLFLFQLLLIIAFLLLEVLLPPHISLIAIPCKLVLQRLLPDIYTAETEVHIHPYFSTGMLFVSVTTLVLFFASGTYSDKIAYAHKYVPHANRALRSFNMYLNVRQPPLRSKIRFNPLAFFFPRPHPASEPPSPTRTSTSTNASPSSPRPAPSPAIGSQSTSSTVPIPPMPPSSNPRGELRLSSRVDRTFREGYERYRANFERKRAQQERARAQAESWVGRLRVRFAWVERLAWWRGDAIPVSAGTSGTGVGRAPATAESSRSGTPPISTSVRQKEKEKDREGSGGMPPTTPRRQRSSSPLRPTIAERRSTPPLPSLARGRGRLSSDSDLGGRVLSRSGGGTIQ